jgi:hypothetical protein
MASPYAIFTGRIPMSGGACGAVVAGGGGCTESDWEHAASKKAHTSVKNL